MQAHEEGGFQTLFHRGLETQLRRRAKIATTNKQSTPLHPPPCVLDEIKYSLCSVYLSDNYRIGVIFGLSYSVGNFLRACLRFTVTSIPNS